MQQKENPDRPLPVNRQTVEDFEYGVKDPEKIPEGKATLKQVLQFITDHQNNSKLHNSEKISNDYKIPEDTISNFFVFIGLSQQQFRTISTSNAFHTFLITSTITQRNE